MGESILEKQIVLSLNANWQAVGHRTVRQAIISMCGGDGGTAPALALDVDIDESGRLVSATPTKWDDWVNLPVRTQDLSIQVKDGRIRAPTIIVTGYKKMPQMRPRLTSRSIMERDNFTCQYSGKKLSKKELNLDHVIPVSRGGRNDWSNIVTCDRQLNSHKSNRLNHEVGLKLLRKPQSPPTVPASFSIHALHPSHKPFLTKEQPG